jgi:hypothetical protein
MGCTVSDAAIIAILADQKHVARNSALGSMQSSAQSGFVPPLRDIAKDRNDPGWVYTIDALSGPTKPKLTKSDNSSTPSIHPKI